MNIYDFTVKARDGKDVNLDQYKGDVLLIVNTATGCGFTPQYKDLEKIYTEYKDKGFTVLDFPCNQFFDQAPGSDEEIHTFCTLNYGTDFPQFAKIEVLGENASPLFKFLTEQAKFKGIPEVAETEVLRNAAATVDPDYKNNDNVKWNFTKFLINRDGEVIERFEPVDSMEAVEKAVEKAVNA